ncbi:transcriptional regulator, LacI family [Fervidobacterium changbaicum]|uniref:LacI family transcriptional regulator n=1 Tax=Fervidobacterium changbaicum TaxID=310769 RepID=A0ABX5QSH1_9BACT|nr:LacI family DNA-binding transcriptional regulator [Fervidobacterium changbaicum]QAV33380.1 LacI family transcriptional regulator [Fervidobacterium changbaicum]SDG90564.1 transcriptional regulator, LacI family [Fervidobacterium changbaicum]
MVSIDDIAKKAGVSTATVSRVLNGTGYVSEETEIKVLKAVRELGYVPHTLAKTLARKKTFSVAVVISKRISELIKSDVGIFYKIILEAIENAASIYKVSVDLVLLEEVIAGEHRTYDGYILVGSDASEEEIEKLSRSSKVVLVDHYIDGLRVDSIVSDGYDGIFYITKKFIDSGFNRIIHIHGPLKYYGFRDRYNGYVAAMTKFGKLPLVFEYDDLHEEIDSVLRRALRDWVPEVIICSNDPIAIKVLNKLKLWGYRVPEDVSIIGFDDIPAAEKEGLSTLRVQKVELGVNAVKRINEILSKQSAHPYKQCIYTTYIKRNSSVM